MKYRKTYFLIFFMGLFNAGIVCAQQNHSLFLWHDVTQSNLLNPAVPISCKWYVGIPVLSSIHVNYANSSFTYNQLFTKENSGAFNPNLSDITDKLHFRNFMGTELHTQLFALAYKHEEYSFMFTVTEKNNLPLTYPKELIQLLLEGNAQFIGDEASLKGTGVYFNHYREYGLGVSKKMWNGVFVGVRTKLLFGKLNVSTRSTQVNLVTDETTFDLNFSGDVLINTSLPIIVDASDNRINGIAYNENVSPMSLAFNRKNPGFALDAGVIYPLSEKIELSASLLDLGFIRWRSNLNSFEGEGTFAYQGALGDTINTGGYFQNLGQAFLDGMQLEVYPKKYTTFLPPRLTMGANYKVNRMLSGGVVGDVIIHKTKTLPSLTLVAQVKPLSAIGILGSYTLQNYSFNNLGLGLFFGRNPVQFYVVSENVLAVFKPLNARMANVRFGFNINLGCSKQSKDKPGLKSHSNTCFGMDNPNEKKYMKKVKPWSKRKKNNPANYL